MAFIALLILFVTIILFITGTIILIIGIILKIKKRQSPKFKIASNILIIISVLMLTPSILMSTSGAISKHKRNNKYGVLYLNAKNRNWDKVISLVEKGKKPDGEYHVTPLMEACRSKEFKMVKYLTENGADVNAISEVGHSPLYFSLQDSDEKEDITLQIVQYLITNGATVTEEILLESCEYDNVEVVKLLIQSDPNNFVFNSSPLVVACDFTNYKLIDYLISLNVDINKKNGYGQTALMKASEYIVADCIPLITLLINNGADISIKDQHDRTALTSLKERYYKYPKETQEKITETYKEMAKLLSPNNYE